MKVLKVLCVVAIAFALTATAYAETQSVKISGDITVRGFARENFDLQNGNAEPANATQSSDWATFVQSALAVQVDADLTDNVGAVIRLVNQRVWGDNNYTSDPQTIMPSYNGALGVARRHNIGGVAQDNDSYTIDVDLAYIELKEFLYSPLTLRIGRQDLWFGNGFIVGRNMQDPGQNLYAVEYTEITSFDAIRATLDYDPWTIDLVYSKISENAMSSDDDMDLAGVNVGYIFDQYNAEAEAYYWLKQSRNPGTAVGSSWATYNNNIDNSVHTIGARGSFDPIEDWTVALEGAVQMGKYIGYNNQEAVRDRHAWAVDALVECRVFQDDFAWRPVLSVEYILYSGEENPANVGTNSDWTGWDPMFRGKFDTAIREFQNVFYATTQASSPSFTNQHQILGKIVLEPTDDITVAAKYANFWLDQVYQDDVGSGVATNTNKHVGQEVDVQVIWDYTEDVSFGLLAAWFYPGNHFASFQDKHAATDVVGTVKLTF